MRRRRKPRVVWLPLDTTNSVRADGRSTLNEVQLAINNATQGNQTSLEAPIVQDFNAQQALASAQPFQSLADIEQSGYRLRRIVGKIFVNTNNDDQGVSSTNAGAILVTAGFMVRRVDGVTGASVAFPAGDASPVDTLNCMDPWIWRRTWLVSAGTTIATTGFGTAIITIGTTAIEIGGGPPPTNYAHGPALGDGPHVDAKTARIVGPEERLFLDVSATILVPGGNGGGTELIVVSYDLRVLGSMRTNTGNRRNANR